MSDLAFSRNVTNGKMEIAWGSDGDVVWDDTEQHAVMSALVIARAKWWADTQGTLGSQLDEVRTITASTKSDVEAYAREALAELVKAGRITVQNVVVNLPSIGQAGRIELAVYWSVRGSNEVQVTRIYV